MGETFNRRSAMLAMAGLVVLGGVSQAAVIVQPSDNASVYYTDAASGNNNGSTWLGSAGGEIDRKFLKFDLPAQIGAHSNITSAVLTLGSQNPTGLAAAYGVLEYVADDSWTSAGITWVNQPAATGAGYNVSIPYTFWYGNPSGELKDAFSEGGDDTLSFRLRGNIEDVNQSVYDKVSLAGGDTYLTIEYVPEPSGAALLLIAMLPLARRKRRV